VLEDQSFEPISIMATPEKDRKQKARALEVYTLIASQSSDSSASQDAKESLLYMQRSQSEGPGSSTHSLGTTPLKKAAWWCAAVCCLTTLSLTMIIPFSSSQRDKQLCMTSCRSALGLVGGVVVGRLSDSVGRKAAILLGLVAGITGTLLFGSMDSLSGLWLSMLPTALFSHQFLVLKAVVSDWAESTGASAAARGEAMGILGTAAG
jgi:hypothetical protein